MISALAVLALAGAAAATAPSEISAGVVRSLHGRRCNFGAADALATGQYIEEVEKDGWGKLWVTASESAAAAGASSEDQAFAAGCVHGHLLQHRMFQYWRNYEANEYGKGKGPCASLEAFIDAQMIYTDQVAVAKTVTPVDATPDFISGLGHITAQFEGLVQGYAAVAPPSETLTRREIYMLNSVGDLEDLDGICSGKIVLNARAIKAIEELTGKPYPPPPAAALGFDPVPQKMKLTDCSGFVRVTPGAADLILGQATWRSYYAMLRTYNVFSLPYTPAGVVSFSASPGFLMSKDDYAVSGGDKARLMIFETTNSVFYKSLYNDYLTPRSMLTWQRSAIGMQWATSGPEYVSIMKTNQSGTYNNQWVVADNKLFVPGNTSLPKDLLWAVELVPGLTQSADITPVLQEQGYWPSYNIPYFPAIYNISGYLEAAARYGNDYVYAKAPRANIFRRNATDVSDPASLGNLLRYNNYKFDPLAGGDPISGAIASRGDLAKPQAVAFGAVDAKVTSFSMANNGSPTTFAICGPTHVQQPVFSWAPNFSNVTHDGVPASFPFDWVEMPVAPPSE